MMVRRILAGVCAGTLVVAMSGGMAMAQPHVVDVDAQPGATEAPPILSADELDTLVGSIALYPDPLIAQLLPASTYPLDIVRAERLVQSGGQAQIDQQNWDPSVKVIAHYPTVLEFMNSNLDWTQQLGQAFVAQPDDVMASIQRLRQKAQTLGNLTSTPQAQVLEQDNAICIVPANPSVIYVPVYQPEVVYYTRPSYPCITFGFGFALGAWFDLDCDWHNHYIYRPGWTWDHWHDNVVVERGRIVRVTRPEFRPNVRPSYAWHRDTARPLFLPGRKVSRPSDFDHFRGRDEHAVPVRKEEPHHVEVPRPVPDRGREVHPSPPITRPGITPGQGNRVEDLRDRGMQSLRAKKDSEPKPVTPAPAPAPRPAPAPAPKPMPAPAPRPTPAPQPKPAPAPQPRPAAPPAKIPTPPVHVAPPPSQPRQSAPAFTGRPSSPAPAAPGKDDSHRGRG